MQGQSVRGMPLAETVSLMAGCARPLALEFDDELVRPRTPTKLGGTSVWAMTDAFFVGDFPAACNQRDDMPAW